MIARCVSIYSLKAVWRELRAASGERRAAKTKTDVRKKGKIASECDYRVALNFCGSLVLRIGFLCVYILRELIFAIGKERLFLQEIIFCDFQQHFRFLFEYSQITGQI